MPAFGKLDEATATLRLLYILKKEEKGLGVMEIYQAMKNEFNVGRGATDTARKICEQLDLVETKDVDIGAPRPALIHTLTQKGQQLAEKVIEFKNILEA